MDKTRFVASLALLVFVGCHKGDGPAAPAPAAGAVPHAQPAPAAAPSTSAGALPQHVDGTPHTDAVENAWRGAGLASEGFAPLQPGPYGAAYCEEGRVQNIDTVVCEYGDQDSLSRGQAFLLDQWGREGGHTGVAFRSKLTLVGAVDRAGSDPNGKVIHRAIDIFRKL